MKIALLGNPNTGKSTVFNLLTGLRQHVGNFPGVTVDKKMGEVIVDGEKHEIIDFPGTYSIYPRSKDEEVVYSVLSNPQHKDYPELAIVVVDASNLERNLFLFTQVYDRQIPSILVLNMSDVASRKKIQINVDQLQAAFPTATIVEMNARIGSGKNRLKDAIQQDKKSAETAFYSFASLCGMDAIEQQEEEAKQRFQKIRELLSIVVEHKEVVPSRSSKLDRVLLHPIFGYLIFAAILLLIFQFIFSFASIPMDFIDGQFGLFSSWIDETLPSGLFTDLLAQGIIPGIGGVAVFIPQIALLFFFISILEESGYLARVVFIMDRLMRPLGLNGRSVVPLMSSVACAIPGIMATRTIPNWKERITTILVAPLMSCSARIPVYTLLIALVIPQERVLGIFQLQGLVLFGLYFLGLISALLVAWVLQSFIRSKEKSFLLLELPSYKNPRWSNVGITVWEKVRVFTLDAGKIILAISIVLWALASYGPGDQMQHAEKNAILEAKKLDLNADEQGQFIASAKLEQSYIGHFGKAIEPIIRPLGYDWKIGISLITSFAAREVFVGSLATIYAVHDESEENKRLIDRMRDEKRVDGTPVYSMASGISLMIFYVYAMQCMATLAVVKRETKSWLWPFVQIGFMGVLAYLGALVTYQLFI